MTANRHHRMREGLVCAVAGHWQGVPVENGGTGAAREEAIPKGSLNVTGPKRPVFLEKPSIQRLVHRLNPALSLHDESSRNI
jgi:hypothetical protein